MAQVAVAAVIVGTILKAKSDSDASKSRQRAANAKAAAKALEAEEILDRSVINQKLIKIQGAQFIAEQQGRFAASGVVINEGTPLNVLQETTDQIFQRLLFERKLAEFDAEQLRRGGEISRRTAADEARARPIRTTGTIIAGAGQLFAAGS